MKSHWVTAAFFIGAGLLYIAGLNGAGALALGGGVVLELWFWVRLFQGRRRTVGLH